MKRSYAVFAVVFAVSILIGIQAVEVEANPITSPTIRIVSPELYYGFVYQNTTIPLVIQLNLLVVDTSGAYSPQITHVAYSLDGQKNNTISAIPKSGTKYDAKDIFGVTQAHFVALLVNATLSNLSDGQHTVKVYSFDINGGVMSTSVKFVVLTTYKIPEVEIVSPINQAYNTSEIPLTCIIRGEYEQLCYAIDSHYNVTIWGNTTLNISGLANGCHVIRIHASTSGRYGGQNWTFFNVGNPTNNPTNNPTSPTPSPTPNQSMPTINADPTLPVEFTPSIAYILAFLIVIVAVASVSLVYFRRRKGELASKPT
jgi:hypothetical protein